MTSILAFEISNAPILVADLLLTADKKGANNSKIPLIDDLKYIVPSDAKFSVVGTKQKLVILNGIICVAWSGRLIFARSLLKYLETLEIEQDGVKHQKFAEFMSNYPKEDLGDLEFIIYARDPSGGFSWLSNIPPFELGMFQNIRVAGSGTPHVISYLETISEVEINGSGSEYFDISMRALTYASLATVEQAVSGAGIADRWGGGFEVVLYDGVRLYKLGPILWVYCDISINKTGKYDAHIVKKYIYQYTIEDSTYFEVDDGDKSSTELYLVTAPHSKQVEFHDPIKVYEPSVIVCGVRLTSQVDTKFGAYIDHTKPGGSPPIQMIRKDGLLHIATHPSFLDRLFQSFDLTASAIDSVAIWDNPLAYPSKE